MRFCIRARAMWRAAVRFRGLPVHRGRVAFATGTEENERKQWRELTPQPAHEIIDCPALEHIEVPQAGCAAHLAVPHAGPAAARGSSNDATPSRSLSRLSSTFCRSPACRTCSTATLASWTPRFVKAALRLAGSAVPV